VAEIVNNLGQWSDPAVPGSPANSLTWSSEFRPDQPGHGSLYFDGQQSPSLVGAYLTTGSATSGSSTAR
jgi:hypothetical protein